MATIRYGIVFVGIVAFFAACLSTWKDFDKETGRTYSCYLTGNVNQVKAALLDEEKIIAKQEASGNRSVDYVQARMILYGRLCAVAAHMGQTNDSEHYFHKALEQKLRRTNDTNSFTVEGVIATVERADREAKPKWREQKFDR